MQVYVPKGPPQEAPVVFGYIEVSYERYTPNICTCIYHSRIKKREKKCHGGKRDFFLKKKGGEEYRMVLKPFRLLYGLLKDSWSFGKAEHEILVKRNEV